MSKSAVPKYKLNRSSGFASDTVRTYFDNLYFKTNQQMKAELRKQTGYKDVMPRPPFSAHPSDSLRGSLDLLECFAFIMLQGR